MTSDEIRESFLSFFEKRDHKRLPSASLVPASYDPSVLLTTAGMHPLKPYFQGLEAPPHHRLTSCQKCFRTPDIDVVGTTTRHLTFFEMLGNFSLGDYFKQGAAEFAWEMSLEGFKFPAEKIWVTVFEGDEELGLGPDEEAIDAWLKIGVPRERIVLCPRSENFWQAGPTGPCGPCSELYYDRGLEWGKEDDLPGGENERFLEYWNLVFMQYNQDPVNTLTPLPKQNIDTGLGLNRMALIQQGVDSVFDTDQFIPLMQLGRSLATNEVDERALRILADHTRGMTFLIADGVVPSNEDRGYVLRRLMRRAIAQGHRLGIEGEFLTQYVDVVQETMGAAYPELGRERDTILRWVRAEEQGFGRTLETGLSMLDDLLGRGEVSGEDAFKLHDTFGFPIDLTTEIAGERGVAVDIAGFDELMEEQRLRSSAGAGAQERVGAKQEVIRRLSEEPTEFTGYEHLEERTTISGVIEQGGRTFVKLATSPFYAQGGGQVSDEGVVLDESGGVVATVNEVLRAGEDQAVVLEGDVPQIKVGDTVVARVDRPARLATQANHTATHLLHAALRQTLGTHVRQAGSYVGPDKLRFDFTHGERLSAEELKQVEDLVNGWILRNDPVRPITTTLKEAQELGAMALFGEKYGDVVRMVQIGEGDHSRELCGGTHVRSTAEIGVFKIVSEGSSASNVRRIEAVTGPEAVTLLRSHDGLIREAAAELRTSPEQVPAKVADLQKALKDASKKSAASNGAVDVAALAGAAEDVDGARVLTSRVEVGDAKALLDATDRVKNALGDAAIVLGAVTEGKVALIASVAPSLVQRGLKAGELVKVAAQVVGGGGGGRDTMAQAGGRDPEKLGDALAAARAHIEATLAG
ncbi:MAG TPA: alanine--tRNA ligase [Baekduia sp.]|uniref:alanine--tRNA ligase n=1 Tax=Baekduia sp. TaxID=2600305 RepID=UPI002D771A3A|nr:alanine--tRNA ligase [Baekduia sp.]HET6506282.1 alanine--tRNA ligase [Baekduia sp.]